MPKPYKPTPSSSLSSAASVAYGMGSSASSSRAKPSPSSKPSSYSDFADLPGPPPPPPNRGCDLDISRFASFERKAEALALTEELLLAWLRDQSRYTLSADVDLAELNRATRILYRLTAIQKTMLSLDAILKAQRNNQPAPDDVDPCPPLDPDPDPDDDDDDDDLLGARASTPAIAPAIINATESTSAQGTLAPPSAPSFTHTQQPPSMPHSNNPPSNPSPRSALHIPPFENPQSTPAASVRACPTLPRAQFDRAFSLNAHDLSRLTGAPLDSLLSEATPAAEPHLISEPSAEPTTEDISVSAGVFSPQATPNLSVSSPTPVSTPAKPSSFATSVPSSQPDTS